MEIRIEAAELLADGRGSVTFTARHGSARGIWCGPAVKVHEIYQIEFTLLDELELARNVEIIAATRFGLSMAADLVVMVVRVESIDDDGVAGVRLGTDCLFLADVVGGGVRAGDWLRASVPFGKLEVWPYDSGSFTVIER